MRGNAELPRPALEAMVLCDHAIREVTTSKITLVGVFDLISSDEFPVTWGHEIFVYSRVTDAQGTYPIRLELVRLDDEVSVGRLDGQAEMADRVKSNELVFQLVGV